MKSLSRNTIIKIFDWQKKNLQGYILQGLCTINKILFIETENLTIDDFRKIRTPEFWQSYNEINIKNFESETIFQIERLQKEFLYKKILEYKIKEKIKILYNE